MKVLFEVTDFERLEEIINDVILSSNQENELGIDIIECDVRDKWNKWIKQYRKNLIENIRKEFHIVEEESA